jgi:hypothetical protein
VTAMTAAKRTSKASADKSSGSKESKKEQVSSLGQSRKNLMPIVGIGASAGGLEAFSVLLKALAPDLGMAFVLVPHLDPSRESAFTQILAKTTSMPVVQIEDNMPAEANNVYIIPPNCDLTITVKGEDGITFAQDTQSAKYHGMPASANAPLTDAEKSERDKQIAQLKQELSATKEYLQSIIETHEATKEELQSANEEIQSGNEELQSTNEELQTSKEELESANEELHRVNEEMQHRNELLAQLNNDLTNLLNSVNLPMVMMAADLSVRRFTPQTTAVLGLMASDVGRPIPRLKLKIEVTNLEQMMLDVIQEVQPKQYHVEDHEGRWCTLRITPYRTLDNRVDGVVLTVLDGSAFEKLDGSKPPKGKPKKKVGSATAKTVTKQYRR